jgi:hydroxymethylbilane synthase
MTNKILRIGTRSSPLAMTQANLLKSSLEAAHPDLSIEIVPVKSAADWKKQDGEKSLSEQAGGKGQFAKEIESIHLEGKIDCGVHSLKDMPAFLPDGLQIKHFLPRADVRDAFISHKYNKIEDLPQGAIVGTCSPRRKALILSRRPDVNIVPFRGNVQTRLEKVRSGQVDATFLAMAGLERLQIKDEMIHPLPADSFLPACGQGVICMEIGIEDTHTQELMTAISCVNTGYCAHAEREVLKILDGSCHTPIGAYAFMKENQLHLKAIAASLDGKIIYHEEQSGLCHSDEDATTIGEKVGHNLKNKLPEGFLS